MRRDMAHHHLTTRDVCSRLGIAHELIVEFIRQSWVCPVRAFEDEWELDDEDIARIRLIRELREDFGVNDESMPIILGLLDQLYAIQARLKDAA